MRKVKIIGFIALAAIWVSLVYWAQKHLDVNPNAIISSPSEMYWLGTDHLGRSLAPLMITGLTNTLIISATAILISIVIALLIGGLATYYGDHSIAINRGLIVSVVLSVSFIFYTLPILSGVGMFSLPGAIIVLFVLIMLLLSYFTFRLLSKGSSFWRKKMGLPLDFLGLKSIELFSAIPLIFIVLAASSLVSQKMTTLILLLGLTSWSNMARLIRGEVIKEKNKPYMKTAHLLGFSKLYIFHKHLLPNIISPLIPAISFGMVNIIVIESSLTFIGVGLPPESVSLGKIMSQYLSHPNAWWLSLFPGVLLVLVILLMHRWSSKMTFKFS